jgi:DNA 3'-phosphatase
MYWSNNNSFDCFVPITASPAATKLFMVDLDSTLVVRRNGKNPLYFDKDVDNWLFIGDMPAALNSLYVDGWTVVIVTNQGWTVSGSREIIRARIEKIRQALHKLNGWSPFILINYKNSEYRKPSPDSLKLVQELLKISTKRRITDIIVCGDAIGETSSVERYKWSDVDFQFYLNIKDIFVSTTFIAPNTLMPSNRLRVCADITGGAYDVIIMMGNPGSTKSTFARELCASNTSYVHLEKDVYKTDKKLMKEAVKQLRGRNKVIVDATYPSESKRNVWKVIAIEMGKTCAVAWCILDGRANNAAREHPVPDIVYNIYSKNFEPPCLRDDTVYMIH